MKLKSILSAGLLLLSASAMTAQTKWSIGGGIFMPSVSAKAQGISVSVDAKTTFYLSLNSHYSLEGLNNRLFGDISLQWGQLKYGPATSSYLALPFSLRYQISKDIPLSFGIGAYLGGEIAENDFTLDYGISLKARYDLSDRFYIQASHNIGLREYSDESVPNASAKLSYTQLGVGFTL